MMVLLSYAGWNIREACAAQIALRHLSKREILVLDQMGLTVIARRAQRAAIHQIPFCREEAGLGPQPSLRYQARAPVAWALATGHLGAPRIPKTIPNATKVHHGAHVPVCMATRKAAVILVI